MLTIQVDIEKDQIALFCRRWQVREMALFGSVLREDFGPDSDVDVLVSFSDTAQWDSWDVLRARDELRAIFGRDVDLVEKRNLTNPFRRHAILSTKQVIYAV
ncbi:MAG TPA: nucleotidyltransferase domain-containing protein [Pirellulales bacterium]|nr:nucleotidyltransferase domain-containing protein [Pirellulales bacterium]